MLEGVIESMNTISMVLMEAIWGIVIDGINGNNGINYFNKINKTNVMEYVVSVESVVFWL